MNKLFRKRLVLFACVACLLFGTLPVSATGTNTVSGTTLNKDDIEDILYGACFLGAGGGGKLDEGLTMLNKLPSGATVNLLPVSEMDSNAYGAVTAIMGAPSSMTPDTDLTLYAKNAFNALSKVASKMATPKTLSYSLVGELGGANTMVPIAVAIDKNIPLIDADGCGRACPTLPCCLFNVNYQTTAPVALADGVGNTSVVNTVDPFDAQLCEDLSRVVTVNFEDSLSGFACWMHNKSEIESSIAVGTISKAKAIGKIITDNMATGTPKNIVPSIQKSYDITQLAQECIITDYTLAGAGGFDKGTIEFQDFNDPNRLFKVYFQNENLIIWKKYTGDNDWVPLMTAPDSIMYFDAKTGTPYCSADLADGVWQDVTVTLCLMPVDNAWWNSGDVRAYQYWAPLIHDYYAGSVLKYENLPPTVGAPINTTYYQAEDVDNPDTGCAQYLLGYTGDGHVVSVGDSVDDMVFNINVPEAGNYDLSIRYAQLDYTATGAAQRSVIINGNTAQANIVSFPHSTEWNEVTISKQLNAGNNTITISSNNYLGDVYIDRFKLTPLP